MSRHLTHRGPDDDGLWIDNVAGVGFGHCRLSILDLSAAGHQPMTSANGRYVLSYNGELYNHADLRRELGDLRAAPAWRGHSDTETLLAAISHWGPSAALRRTNGMFAFALWDREKDVLYLARDRLGEKPLYYGSIGGTFLFASELSALMAHPNWEGRIDPTALSLYLKFGYVPAPWSIFSNVYKLKPAHYLKVGGGGSKVGSPIAYWDLEDISMARPADDRRSHEEIADELHDLLHDAVGRRMQADVPVGSFLSGGIDSSTVTALMQAQSPEPVKTFTIGFTESEFDEAKHASAVARHLGTDHTELYVTAKDALDTVPLLPKVWNEPFADSSQIPTFLVSELARSRVKVVLSGDGGDELFAGYRRYRRTQRLWQTLQRAPESVRKQASQLLRGKSLRSLDHFLAISRLSQRVRPVDQRVHKLVDLLSEETRAGFYEQVISHWSRPELVITEQPSVTSLLTGIDRPWLKTIEESMMWVDTHLYLPDDILVKLDRASMSQSLEARVPLLDHRVVEFAWKLPMTLRTKGGSSKAPLRDVLYKYVPRELVDRDKMGFAVPIEDWLRGPLREWGEELLDPDQLREQGVFDVGLIRQTWDDHIRGRARNHFQLWDILMFQAWMATWRPSSITKQS